MATMQLTSPQRTQRPAVQATSSFTANTQSYSQAIQETFLYRFAGGLKLSATPLHTGKDQWRCWSKGSDRNTANTDEFEFIASGSHEDMLGLAHSLMLGLNNPMRGI
ncbi:MAG: hypothetical protein AAF959_09570 [Cyanobacteria bacterium P01_D01_bin.56]